MANMQTIKIQHRGRIIELNIPVFKSKKLSDLTDHELELRHKHNYFIYHNCIRLQQKGAKEYLNLPLQEVFNMVYDGIKKLNHEINRRGHNDRKTAGAGK